MAEHDREQPTPPEAEPSKIGDGRSERGGRDAPPDPGDLDDTDLEDEEARLRSGTRADD